MNDEVKWWFAAANHAEIKGESTGDKEIFKSAPYISLAREIIQNSIDARDSDEEPVKIKFKEFSINKEDIPGVNDYLAQLRRCSSYWRKNNDLKKHYDGIIKYLEDSTSIKCLRISDENTTGLSGINSTDSTADNPYNALVKGSGVTQKKSEYAGGSKGVGKNVPFLLSQLEMVFYSTRTTDGFSGYIGVGKLGTGYIDDNEEDTERDYTQGTGYFARTSRILPIFENLNLDSGYNDRDTKSGTDIYIIGFESMPNWINEVINSTLTSFMAALVKDELDISFNGIEINAETIDDFIHTEYVEGKNKKEIIAQYEILKNVGNDVQAYDIETELGNAVMYIKKYAKEDEQKATKKCTMIRTPLMKINNIDVTFGVSAMVIIGPNDLGKELRSIENAQHNAWQVERIKDLSHKREINYIIQSIKEQINQHVMDCLKLGDDAPIDPNGAGEFLSDEDEGDSASKDSKKIDSQDDVEIGIFKKRQYRENDSNINDDNGFGEQPEIGTLDQDDEGDESFPNGKNSGTGGEPRTGENTGNKDDGENQILVRANLTNVKYKVISTNRREGKLRIIFIAPESQRYCYLSLALIDDSNNSIKVRIQELKVNNQVIEYDDFFEPGPFEIVMNRKMIIDIQVDRDEYFACEVKVKYENRQ